MFMKHAALKYYTEAGPANRNVNKSVLNGLS